MIDIENTEASIVPGIIGKHCGKITKLAGMLGEDKLKLYITSEEYNKLPLVLIPYLSFGLSVDVSYNHFAADCNNLTTPIKKGDSIIFCFEDKTMMKIVFPTGGLSSSGVRKNFAIISDLELSYLWSNKVEKVKVQNNKNGISLNFEFASQGNDQYENIEQGKRLLQIMAKRLVGAKSLLLTQINA